MNISFSWIKEYVDLEGMTPQELDDLLTFSGLEIEGVEKVESIKGGLEHVVIAQVLTCEPHTTAITYMSPPLMWEPAPPSTSFVARPMWPRGKKWYVHRLAPRYTPPTRSFMR